MNFTVNMAAERLRVLANMEGGGPSRPSSQNSSLLGMISQDCQEQFAKLDFLQRVAKCVGKEKISEEKCTEDDHQYSLTVSIVYGIRTQQST